MNNLNNIIKNLNENKVKLLKLCYILVAIIILLLNLFLSAFNLIFLEEQTLNISDFELLGIEFVDENTVITEIEDSQMIYSSETPILNLYFKADTSFNVGEWILFYQDDLDKNFSISKMLYAKSYDEYYYFSLPINTQKIRFDLGVTSSNTIDFEELILNKSDFNTINAFDSSDLFNFVVFPIILYVFILLFFDIYLKSYKIITKSINTKRNID